MIENEIGERMRGEREREREREREKERKILQLEKVILIQRYQILIVFLDIFFCRFLWGFPLSFQYLPSDKRAFVLEINEKQMQTQEQLERCTNFHRLKSTNLRHFLFGWM